MTIVLTPSTVPVTTLNDYLTDVQRLLHDSSFNFWAQDELISYINKARRKVAAETGCTRQLIPLFTLEINQNSYDFLSLLSGKRVSAILDIFVYYSTTTRYPLRYFPFSTFSREGSVMYAYQGYPIIYSQSGNSFFISPVPQMEYMADIDVLVEPEVLINLTDVDADLSSPFNECVKYYACYLAKLKDQRRQQAEEFFADYMRERSSALSSGVVRRLVGA